jgi:hypothetical protein
MLLVELPARTLTVVTVLTPPLVYAIKGRLNHCSHVRCYLEVFDLHVYLLAVFRQQGC